MAKCWKLYIRIPIDFLTESVRLRYSLVSIPIRINLAFLLKLASRTSEGFLDEY